MPSRSGARPRFVARRSDAWSTPKQDEGADVALDTTATPMPDDAPTPLRIDPEVNVDQRMPISTIEFEQPKPLMERLKDAARSMREAPIDLMASSLGGDRIENLALQLAVVGPTEIDQLWDWVRADREGVMNFLGFIPEHSIKLFQWIANFQTLEAEGRARFASIYLAGGLVGFLMLHPIQKSAKGMTGDCHLYLSHAARGNLHALLPALLDEVDRVVPHLSLRVVTARDDEWVRLLRGVGFTTQIVLTRPAASTGSASGT